MVTFVSLFLGLVLGTVNVKLAAAPEVATIQLLLDGRQVTELRAPWSTTLDLGRELAPHELVAVARDANGYELGMARQGINLPRRSAEAGFVLAPGKGGTGRVARLVWRCFERESPVLVTVRLDGKVLPAPHPERIELPPYASGQPHLLRADLEFGGGSTATAEMVFGGQRMTESTTALTAIPVILVKGQSAPSLERLEGAFASDGKTIRAEAIEKGLAEVDFVLAGRATGELFQMASGMRGLKTRLGAAERFRFLWTVPLSRTSNAESVDLFPTTKELSRWDGAVLEVGSELVQPGNLEGEQIAPAVAVAALTASARDRRRAVVLLLGPGAVETSDLPAAEVRRFLGRLRVPLFVWSLVSDPPPIASAYGGAVDASTYTRFGRAVSALSHFLDQLRIVWVEGRHLPQSISLSPGVHGMTLAE